MSTEAGLGACVGSVVVSGAASEVHGGGGRL